MKKEKSKVSIEKEIDAKFKKDSGNNPFFTKILDSLAAGIFDISDLNPDIIGPDVVAHPDKYLNIIKLLINIGFFEPLVIKRKINTENYYIKSSAAYMPAFAYKKYINQLNAQINIYYEVESLYKSFAPYLSRSSVPDKDEMAIFNKMLRLSISARQGFNVISSNSITTRLSWFETCAAALDNFLAVIAEKIFFEKNNHQRKDFYSDSQFREIKEEFNKINPNFGMVYKNCVEKDFRHKNTHGKIIIDLKKNVFSYPKKGKDCVITEMVLKKAQIKLDMFIFSLIDHFLFTPMRETMQNNLSLKV